MKISRPATFAVPRHWLFLKIASDHGSGPATSYVRDFDDQFPLRDSFLREYADVPRGQFEHHGMPGIASSSPPVLIGHIAAATSAIRVGSGGVMLPNHSSSAARVSAYQSADVQVQHEVQDSCGRRHRGEIISRVVVSGRDGRIGRGAWVVEPLLEVVANRLPVRHETDMVGVNWYPAY